MEFHALRLCVANFDESLKFYRDVLCFKGWHNDDQQYAYFEDMNIALFSQKNMAEALFGAYQPMERPLQPNAIIQFEVPDVDDYFGV
ncbi:VOC family protein [Paenibacillus dokdonensis]|uniref:VOC family protein n=1 Tax=Paenibacillus dokdonensis TaxID=2567944 RepID=A0ABU6GMP6_9BACL|nr:VOC family protein [Paenibacillus dokdonensis]MEC0241024.1 VOC family protein [Paenibacillus dokdonensis]